MRPGKERGPVFRYYGVNVTRFVKTKLNSKEKGRGKKNTSKSSKLGTGRMCTVLVLNEDHVKAGKA